MKIGSLACLVIGVAVLAVAVAETRAQAPAASEVAATAITHDDLMWWRAYRRDVWDRGGLHVMSTTARFAGRLVITGANGETQSCGGTLVGERQVLTAAHCVCFDAPDHAACAPSLARVSALFLLPAAGSFASAEPPRVHPRYRRPLTATAGELADLALITLDRAPTGITWAPIEDRSFDPALPHASVSFGPIALTGSVTYPNDSEPLFHQGTQYLPGLGTTAVVANGRLRRGLPCEVPAGWLPAAPRITVVNMFCVRYSDVVDAPGSGEQDYFSCKGDSGSALVERTSDRALRLVGVTSFVSHTASDCSIAVRGGVTFYTDVGAYQPWIAEMVGASSPSPPSPPENRLCIELVRGSGVFVTEFPSVNLSFVSVAVTTHGSDNDVAYPAFSIEAPGSAACTMHARYGFGSCELQGGPVTVRSLTTAAKTRMVFCYRS